MNIYSTNLRDAIKTGTFDPATHVINEKGEITKVSVIKRWTVGAPTIDSAKLAQSIIQHPTDTALANLSDLRDLGYFTTLDKQQIERAVNEAAQKSISPQES